MPCCRPANHQGKCHTDEAIVAEYREYARQVRERAKGMTDRYMLERAAEFHRIAWAIYRHEYNGR